VDQDIHFNEVGLAVVGVFVIHGGISAAHAFEAVIKVDQHFVEGQIAGEHDPLCIDGIGSGDRPPLLHYQLHHIAHVFGRCDDGGNDEGLLHRLDLADIRQVGRIIDLQRFAVSEVNAINDVRVRGDDVEVEFAAQALLNNLHVKKPQKAAAEAETERDRRFRLITKRGIIESELIQALAEFFIIAGLHRINPGKHHRMNFLKSR